MDRFEEFYSRLHRTRVSLMSQSRLMNALICLIGVTSVWMNLSQADEIRSPQAEADQIATLLSRVQKLELRLEALEGRQRVVRRLDESLVPAGSPSVIVPRVEPQFSKPAVSEGSINITPNPQRQASGMFVPRHIVPSSPR